MTIVLPEAIDVDHFEVDPGEGCGDAPAAAARDVRIETSPRRRRRGRPPRRGRSPPRDRHRMNVVAPAAGADGVRLRAGDDPEHAGRVSELHGHERVRGLHGRATPRRRPRRPPTPTPTATATPTPTAPTRPPTPTADCHAVPTVAPTAGPTVAPAPTPVAPPPFTLARLRQALDPRHRPLPVACPVTRDADRRRRDRPQAAGHARAPRARYKRTPEGRARPRSRSSSPQGPRSRKVEVIQSHVDGAVPVASSNAAA